MFFPLTRTRTAVLWSNIPVNITPGPSRRPNEPPAGALLQGSPDATVDDLDPTVARFVRSTGLTRSLQRGRAPGLFIPGRAVDATGSDPPDSRSCPAQVEFMTR
jgi:hypothetical protein